MRYYDFDKTDARREFQKRNYLFFGLFLGALIGAPILSYLLHLIGIEGAPAFIILPWMLAWIAVGIGERGGRVRVVISTSFKSGGTAVLSQCTACIAVSVPMS